MIQLQATKSDGFIHISENSFEHLLACLDNQKFIKEVNADGMSEDYKEIQERNQSSIDCFNHQCRKLLHDLEA